MEPPDQGGDDQPTGDPGSVTTLGGGRYELGNLLGRGGMAEVRRARDQRLGRIVAIKRLRVDLAGDPTFQARFRREAQSAASLNHPSVVAVYDTGEELDPVGSGMMLPYIVMELVEGRTLRDILREGRKILPERALEIIASVLSALDYSHRAGIVHRDIKPANVMLTPTGDVKVMDFGIARAIADSSATMTQTAAVVGTAQYLSPEQARGEQVDARSDLYSTGCLLYELLTGRPPFIGDSPVSVAYQHVREEAPAPSTIDPQITPAMDSITLMALAKRVDERYQSAAEMRADIERALAGQPVLAPPVPGAASLETEHFLAPTPLDSTNPTAVTQAVGSVEEEGPRRRTGLWVALALILAALVVAALIVLPNLLADKPPVKVQVPSVASLTLTQATQKLKGAGLAVGPEKFENSTTIPAHHIIRQGTSPGTFVVKGSKVSLVVSSGTKKAVVKYVIGDTLAVAEQQLQALGFKVAPKVDPRPNNARRDIVTRTDPNAGVTRPQGSTITVYYSSGYVKVPSVIGEQRPTAIKKLRKAGFNPVTSYQPSDIKKNQVLGQDPVAFTMKPPGSTVTIVVSLGPSGPTSTGPSTTPPTTTPPTTTAPTTTAPTTPAASGSP
ncbi:MAG: Stk1 family PASTA domain-containing Ser/Thr kinase [Nocardioidaceae bacterium]